MGPRRKGRRSEKKKQNVSEVGPKDYELAIMRRARRGMALIIIERRGCCEGAMSPQKNIKCVGEPTHEKFCGGCNVGHLVPCVLGYSTWGTIHNTEE